ncbi:MAG: DNA topoisomerase I [Candidatus Woesearchaeota archaeon]
MSYDLIITEKPSAANKIASALSDKAPQKKSKNGVPYYELEHSGKKIFVACAVGHLYSLAEKDKGKWTYPVFDIEWRPAFEINKEADYTKKYLNTISDLSKNAGSFTVATDYDVEGEVIGLNCVRFACKQKDAKRMKFSTLTKQELIDAYAKASKHLDWGQAHAGETRHFLDWMYGINISRALTLSIKHSTGRYKVLSSGRVQGPALKIIVDKEKEIKKFVSKKFWQIELKFQKSRKVLSAWHVADKFWEKEKADSIVKKTKGHDSVVEKIDKSEMKQSPPVPFDLTTLQTESYRVFKITPKETLALAQELYSAGYMSYPRTSSQKLPKSIGYKNIMEKLSRQEQYKPLVSELLKKPSLTPREGKKTDPAHPAIYPTGIVPKNIRPRAQKVYDLVVKRFFATFGEPATRATMTVTLDANSEKFICKGTKTTDPGWHVFYQPYVKLEEIELPSMEKGESLKTKDLILHEKETQPPRRYTEASIIKELENRGLGTKATRAAIVDTLFQRGYVTGKAIEATILGIRMVDVLKKYLPDIVSEELTREIEIKMEEIRGKKHTSEDVLKHAKKILSKILDDVKTKEKKIGKELIEATDDTTKEQNTLGECPSCKEGNLVIKRGKFGRFVACDKYPDCKLTMKIPQTGLIKSVKKQCEKCGYPLIQAVNKGSRPRILCINPKCPTKKIQDSEIKKEAKEILNGSVEKECPKCKEGKLVVRTSIYGKFFGCSNFPKCRYMERLNDGPLKEDFPKSKAADKNATNKE